MLITQDEAWRRGTTVAAEADRRRRDGRVARREEVLVVRRTGNDVPMTEGRDHWYHELQAASPTTGVVPGEPMDAEDLLFLCTRAARPRSRRGSSTRPAATSSARRRLTTTSSTSSPRQDVFWCAADIGWITGPQLHRLRAARATRTTSRDVRGDARLPRQGPLVGDRRALRRDDPLHGPDRDPLAHEVGARVRAEARPLVAAPARLGRRADQPGGVDLVPRAHRRRATARSSTPGGRPRRG